MTKLPKRYASPIAVFDAYRKARDKRDSRVVFSLLTPEVQNDAVFESFFACMEQGSKEMGPNTRNMLASASPRLKTTMRSSTRRNMASTSPRSEQGMKTTRSLYPLRMMNNYGVMLWPRTSRTRQDSARQLPSISTRGRPSATRRIPFGPLETWSIWLCRAIRRQVRKGDDPTEGWGIATKTWTIAANISEAFQVSTGQRRLVA